MTDDVNPARVAYDTYREAAEAALPAWEDLPDAEQEVWADVAFAVERVTEREPDTVDELLARSGARVDLRGPAPDAADVSADDLEDQAAACIEESLVAYSLVPVYPHEVDSMVGFLPDDDIEHPLVIADGPTGRGFCMSKETAERLADEIRMALRSPFAPWNKPAGPAS
jgi:hypothetical protein